jgi:hypothetical protein
LHAFDIGDLPYKEVRFYLQRLLATGAPPVELLDVLERCEAKEKLPGDAHEEIFRLLNEAIARSALESSELEGAVQVPPLRAEPAAANPAAAPASGPDPGSLAAEQEDSRTMALSAELAAARSSLERERNKAREIDKVLAGRIASEEAARSQKESLQHESERYQAELRALRAALAARDTTLLQVRRSLDEREARLAADLAAVQSALRAEQAKTEEAERALSKKMALDETVNDVQRRAERYQAELRSARDALAARDTTIAQVRHSLGERESQNQALGQQRANDVAAVEARVKSLEIELKAARAGRERFGIEDQSGCGCRAAGRARTQ